MIDPTDHFQRQWEDMDPATAEINRLRDEIERLRVALENLLRISDDEHPDYPGALGIDQVLRDAYGALNVKTMEHRNDMG